MKPGYLALYSHKYKAEKSVNYFCINLKPRRVFRVFVPFTNKELCSAQCALYVLQVYCTGRINVRSLVQTVECRDGMRAN